MAEQNNEKLISLIFNVGRIIKEQVHMSLHISPVEFEVLKFVNKNKNLTMKALADYLHIKPPSVTSIIDGLVEKGELKRVRSNKSDRRVIYIGMTKKGLKTHQKYCNLLYLKIKKVFAGLSTKEKDSLEAILNKVLKNNQK